jgi:hypothetical protein
MAITTLDEAKTQYLENLSYQREGSQLKAQLFIESCDALLMLRPMKTNRAEFGIDFESLKEARDLAIKWLAANPGSSRPMVRFGDFDNFRDHY